MASDGYDLDAGVVYARIRGSSAAERGRLSMANIGQNRFRQKRTGSWQTVMPRSNNKPSTFRSDCGNRTYISSTKRITSGDELKRRNG